MSEIKALIAQHSGSVALSFSHLGINAPVTAKNVIKVVEAYGDQYWELLEDIINSGAGYAGNNNISMQVEPHMLNLEPVPSILNKYANGNTCDADIMGCTAPIADPSIFQQQDGPYPSIHQNPLSVMPLPGENDMPVLQGNGGLLVPGPGNSTQPGSTTTTMTVEDPEGKTFWQKHSTLIIIFIIILLILIIRGRSNAAPVIIK